uniref:Uncharacterized protein n=1 Tax=Onchocerca volvulus TaxID=6282 RepID=A0A8R1TR69_ONCVO
MVDCDAKCNIYAISFVFTTDNSKIGLRLTLFSKRERLLTLTVSLVLIISAETDFERKVWELMDAIYPKMEHLRKCEPNIEINLIYKRLVVNNNIVLCGESKFFQYKRLLRHNLVRILTEFGSENLSSIKRPEWIYCVWPKVLSGTSYCTANSHLKFSSEQVENLHNCSEEEMLAKLEQESPKSSVKVIFKRTEKVTTNKTRKTNLMEIDYEHYGICFLRKLHD